MNHPLITNINGKERHKSLIDAANNHRRVKAINRGLGQKEIFPKFWKSLPLPENRVLSKPAVK